MPPKRKAANGVGSGRASKRSTPNPASSPGSVNSDDEYSSDGDYAVGNEATALHEAVSRYTANARPKKLQAATATSRLFGLRDFEDLELKLDHENRPLWIDAVKSRIIMESFSPLASYAQDFLTTIAEPLSRPSHIHEYTLTTHSLFAAVSVGMNPRDIVAVLDRLSKTPVPDDLKEFIYSSTGSYGKIKLVLKHNRYFVESSDPDVLQMLLKDDVIGPLRIQGSEDMVTEKAPTMGGLIIPGTKNASAMRQNPNGQPQGRRREEEEEAPSKEDDNFITLRESDDEEEVQHVHSFEIPAEAVEKVRKRCLDLLYPVLEEYDFRNDERNATLDIDLRPNAQIRNYQEKSLSKMFGNGRAKSGIIVLPCGAGKTLVGITAACTIKKGIIVLCTSNMSVVQWRDEFLKWSNVNPDDVATFTSDSKTAFTRATGIIVTTYSMVSKTSGRSHDSQKIMDWLTSREWGLMILDEVHVTPASMFRRVTSSIASHSKLGLTATLLREDDKITDLNFLIGPKLYEANWMELSKQGHIARVQCAEVWCPMTAEWYAEYLRATPRKRALLYIMNPRKFQACQFLINYHEKRGDKIIVFSDNVFALKSYALKLMKPYIYGETPQHERIHILRNFQYNEDVNTLFLSKIGDTSLDLPEATCLIQISSHYGSRRQEAQRLGRILRAKRRNDEGFNAFFYSLVSKDTQEMYYSNKRQAFLVDQGYAFKTITHLEGMEKLPGLAYASRSERRELLSNVILQNETAADVEQIHGDLFGDGHIGRNKKGTKRNAATLSELSGGAGMGYIEYNKSRNKELKKGPQNAFMKKLMRDQKKKTQL